MYSATASPETISRDTLNEGGVYSVLNLCCHVMYHLNIYQMYISFTRLNRK